MATATAEQVFMTKYAGLVVTRFGEQNPTKDGPGRPGLRYDFAQEGGVLRVTDGVRERDWAYVEEWGPDLRAEKVLNREQRLLHRQGKLDPREAFFSTEEFLRKRSGETSNFHEVPAAAPDPAPVMQAVMDLAIGRDVEGLAQVLAEEQEGWNRPQVVDAVKRAVQQLTSGAVGDADGTDGDDPPEAA